MRTDDDGSLPGVLGQEEGAAERIAAAADPELADTKLADTKLITRPITGNNRPDTRFAKGISGNPRGRPVGSRSQAVLEREARLAARLDGRLDELADALLAKALSGHVGAIRTVLALSLSRRTLDLPTPAGDAVDEPAEAATPNPVFSAINSSSPAAAPKAAPAAAQIADAVSSARIQPAPDPDLVLRRLTLDAPEGASAAALRACLADLGVPVRPHDQITLAGPGPLAGLVAIEPPPDWRVETRSYLVAAPPGTPLASLADFLHSLGIVLGPADRILGAGRAPRPLLVGVTPPLRIAAPGSQAGRGTSP